MSKKFIVIFTLVFCFLASSENKAQSLLKNGKIPKNLVITYWRGSGIGWSEFTINSDGDVFYRSYSNMPSNPNSFELLKLDGKKTKIKIPNLKDKLSKKQLKNLVSEFEELDFFNFPYIELSKQDGCTNETFSSHSQRISISIQINGKTTGATLSVECEGTVGSRAGNFNNLEKKIGEMLKNVKAQTKL